MRARYSVIVAVAAACLVLSGCSASSTQGSSATPSATLVRQTEVAQSADVDGASSDYRVRVRPEDMDEVHSALAAGEKVILREGADGLMEYAGSEPWSPQELPDSAFPPGYNTHREDGGVHATGE